MIWRKLLAGVLFFLFLLSIPMVTLAQQSGQRRLVRKTILDYRDVLALKPDQVKKIKGYLADFEKEARPIRGKILSLNREIVQLLRNNGDMKKLKKKVKENYSLRADLFLANIETERKIEGVLTPEQLNKWKEIRRNRGRFKR